MSEGRIDVIATPTDGGEIYLRLEALDRALEALAGGDVIVGYLTIAEAQYLRDEITAALERRVSIYEKHYSEVTDD